MYAEGIKNGQLLQGKSSTKGPNGPKAGKPKATKKNKTVPHMCVKRQSVCNSKRTAQSNQPTVQPSSVWAKGKRGLEQLKACKLLGGRKRGCVGVYGLNYKCVSATAGGGVNAGPQLSVCKNVSKAWGYIRASEEMMRCGWPAHCLGIVLNISLDGCLLTNAQESQYRN